MLEDHLESPVTRQRLRSGPAADHIDGFADQLHRLGYKPISIDFRLRQLAGLTDWMKSAGFGAEDLLKGLEECRAALARERHVLYSRGPNHESLVAGSMFIRYLREQGVIAQPRSEPTPVDVWPILGEFRSWMLQYRGVRESTLNMYQQVIIELLTVLGDDPKDYTSRGLRTFIQKRVQPHGMSRAQRTTTSVRAYLRFLGASGRCSEGIEGAIPRYTRKRLASLPRYLEPAERVDASAASRSGRKPLQISERGWRSAGRSVHRSCLSMLEAPT